MGAGPVGRSEVEQAKPGEKFIGLGKISVLKVGFGDLELRGLGEELVVREALAGEFQRGVDDAVETGDREIEGAKRADGAAEFQEGVGRAFILGVFLEVGFVVGEIASISVNCVGARAALGGSASRKPMT